MKVWSSIYLTTFEIEPFDFSGKIGLEILCLFVAVVMLIEKWRFRSGIIQVRLSSQLIFQNVLVHNFQVDNE